MSHRFGGDGYQMCLDCGAIKGSASELSRCLHPGDVVEYGGSMYVLGKDRQSGSYIHAYPATKAGKIDQRKSGQSLPRSTTKLVRRANQ